MTTKTETPIKVRELTVGDEIVYIDGNQTVSRLDKEIDLDFRTMYLVYVHGVETPRRKPGSAPVTVLR